MYKRIFAPLLFCLPPEVAHGVVFSALRVLGRVPFLLRLLARLAGPAPSSLRVRAMGLDFPNPIGLAAGLDKDGVAIDALAALGFGFVEVGTLTAERQAGNPKPRLFRLRADRALLNRMGFNNCGAEEAGRRLARRRRGGIIVGINIGKTRAVPDEDAAIAADYAASARALAGAADYLVINVSSPNTPGLRGLQSPERLRPLLEAVRAACREACPERSIPLLIKISPDLRDEEIDSLADLALELGLAGIIATNTTVSREGLTTDPEAVRALGPGGVSGRPLKARSLQVLGRLHARVRGRLVLISAGGIESADDAWERLRAGATLVQIYTALVYEGPTLPRRLARGLAKKLGKVPGFPKSKVDS